MSEAAESEHSRSPPGPGGDPAALASQKTPYEKAGYRYYVLAVLTLVYACNFIDRQLLVILQEPIKAELDLSDTQLGLLTGFAFALFYVVCGIPIARWADRGVRRSIIALALTVWSAMTAISGLTQNYLQLLLARVGVGVGEAGGSPPAHSMISDIFDRKHRATALAIYSVGIYIGILGGYLLGGWVTEFFGWRLAFFVVGAPGILLAILLRLTVSEPPRGWSEGVAHRASVAPPVSEVARLLWSRRSFRHIALAASLQAYIIYAIGNWLPSFFLRSYDISIGELGTWMALTTGFGGGIGSFFGGWLADRLGAKDSRWYLWVPASLTILTVPVLMLLLTTGSLTFALLLVAPFNFLTAAYLGAVLAVSHNLVGLRMRALTSAIVFFIINLIGMGLGPASVGMLSDTLSKAGVETPLRNAMLVFGVVAAVWACLHYLLATRTVRDDIAKRSP